MGVGARVSVSTPKGKLLGVKDITLNVGYSGSRAALVHFGLGTVEVCDVEITLPSRAEPLMMREVKVNRVVTAREP